MRHVLEVVLPVLAGNFFAANRLLFAVNIVFADIDKKKVFLRQKSLAQF